MLDYTAISRPL
jgi:hypothetical protein